MTKNMTPEQAERLRVLLDALKDQARQGQPIDELAEAVQRLFDEQAAS